ncbi:MAG: proline/glycine betaine ABC transporter permease [Kurthia sp.]|nr:proline/glycine betaine ABC transporter permease [Candidatus Kurthia equi]
MNSLLDKIPQIPLAEWTNKAMDYISDHFQGFFDQIQESTENTMNAVSDLLLAIPAIIMILLIAVLAFFAMKKKFGLAIFTIVGLLFIYNQQLWDELMNTVTLVLFASIISIVLGVPLGIIMSKSKTFESIMKPILDFMQTMPGFVYLIPAVAFFGIGIVPGVFASIIFSIPPTIRFTNLAIQQVPKELIEASESFGSTGFQKLFNVELPLAKSTIMAGINQTVMLALSMVVIASMIGAEGLGVKVLQAVQRAEVGSGFVAGLALVIFAIIIDRLTQSFNNKKGQG